MTRRVSRSLARCISGVAAMPTAKSANARPRERRRTGAGSSAIEGAAQVTQLDREERRAGLGARGLDDGGDRRSVGASEKTAVADARDRIPGGSMCSVLSSRAGMTPEHVRCRPERTEGARAIRRPRRATWRNTASTRANALPRSGSGTSGRRREPHDPADRRHVLWNRLRPVPARSREPRAPARAGRRGRPAYTSAIGKRRSSTAVTIAKLPPPPRIAQKSSGSSVGRRSQRMAAVGVDDARSARIALAARPCFRASQLIPPPSA